MTEYGQFCALARAAEVLGERWTILILRELWLGPARFSDLKERLAPIAPGVLNGRLRALEARGLVSRREVPPPTPARLYELTEAGRELEPVLFALLRWGARYLLPQRPGERFEPAWLAMVLRAYASGGPSPSVRVGIEIAHDGIATPVAVVSGGPNGTAVEAPGGSVDAVVTAPALALLGLISRRISLAEAEERGSVTAAGDREAATLLGTLFTTST